MGGKPRYIPLPISEPIETNMERGARIHKEIEQSMKQAQKAHVQLRDNPELQEGLNMAWDALKEIAEGTVPRNKRHELFTDLDDYPELDDDPEFREVVGWIKGVAEALGVKPRELITCVTEEWRP